MPNGAKPGPNATQKVQLQYICDTLEVLDEKVDGICATCRERERRIRKLAVKGAALAGGGGLGGVGLLGLVARALGWW